MVNTESVLARVGASPGLSNRKAWLAERKVSNASLLTLYFYCVVIYFIIFTDTTKLKYKGNALTSSPFRNKDKHINSSHKDRHDHYYNYDTQTENKISVYVKNIKLLC